MQKFSDGPIEVLDPQEKISPRTLSPSFPSAVRLLGEKSNTARKRPKEK
jgi:hypothetical protein